MSQADRLASLDARFARAFKRSGIADTGTFRRKGSATDLPGTFLLDENVQVFGDQTGVPQLVTTVTAYFADIGQPEPVNGDTFTVGTRSFDVDALSNKDASRVICIVRERGCCP